MGLAWQPSLFADQVAPARIERTPLEGGAWIDHAVGWLSGSDELFAELVATAPWRQRTRHLYDRVVDEPRLTAWWGPKDGDRQVPRRLVEVRTALSRRYRVRFDSVGCNLYRDGSDSVAWHGDTVRKAMAEPIVAIVSLGQPRRLLLRPRGGGPSLRFALGGGDLFVMGGTCQHTWEHSVPKVRAAGARMSVTFRHSSPGGPASLRRPSTAEVARGRTSPAARGSRAGRAP